MDVLCACIYVYCVCELPENARRGWWIWFLFLICVCMWRSEKIQVSVLGWLLCLSAVAISQALTISLH